MTTFNDFGNPQVRNLPDHLRQFIVPQHYDHYTAVDHAVWRYVMRQNYSYLKDVAYYPYIPGLEAAGLTIERIPSLQEMNDALKKIGWGAVTVDGFIPPSAFMEYQSYRVLVIAADIRQLEHIEYTPAPDIIHESAGHAPIIADTDYHNYLSHFGSIGARAMFSSRDYELYEAIRELSILKEMPDPDPLDLRKAEKRVSFCQKNLGEPSEMALLSRLHWWTVEYGLIGTLAEPKIYGAGLLSSIGESKSCMDPGVDKLWYSIDAVNYAFDITSTQPQLFVTPDFNTLTRVLEEFADGMAFRQGGTQGILKAIECKNVCTAVFSSGLQVSGVFTDAMIDLNDGLQFLSISGAAALAYSDIQLNNHGVVNHPTGFCSPVGPVKNIDTVLEDASEAELAEAGLSRSQVAELVFESGISVKGTVEEILRAGNKNLAIRFRECRVEDKDGNILYASGDNQIYDLGLGQSIISVFCGAADKKAFNQNPSVSATPTYHPEYSLKDKRYHYLFHQVRQIRESSLAYEQLPLIWTELRKDYRTDWLCAMEILELLDTEGIFPDVARDIRIYLEMKAGAEPELNKLIYDGFYLISHPVSQLTQKQ